MNMLRSDDKREKRVFLLRQHTQIQQAGEIEEVRQEKLHELHQHPQNLRLKESRNRRLQGLHQCALDRRPVETRKERGERLQALCQHAHERHKSDTALKSNMLQSFGHLIKASTKCWETQLKILSSPMSKKQFC